ncbi:switch-associated protein 70 [Pelomyxa schiedti]|nr:switch-associated protein 70 [Pelomyxa schiedti]
MQATKLQQKQEEVEKLKRDIEAAKQSIEEEKRLLQERLLQKTPEFILKSGFLTKEGGTFPVRKNWKMRWFVLKLDGLYYYETKEDFQPKGIVPLGAVLASYRLPDMPLQKNHNLFVVETPQRNYMLMSPFSDTDATAWVEAINNAKLKQPSITPQPPLTLVSIQQPPASSPTPIPSSSAHSSNTELGASPTAELGTTPTGRSRARSGMVRLEHPSSPENH